MKNSHLGRGAGNRRAVRPNVGVATMEWVWARRFPAPLPGRVRLVFCLPGVARNTAHPWLPSPHPSGMTRETLRVRCRASAARHRFSARVQAQRGPALSRMPGVPGGGRLAGLVVLRKQSGVALRLPPHSRGGTRNRRGGWVMLQRFHECRPASFDCNGDDLPASRRLRLGTPSGGGHVRGTGTRGAASSAMEVGAG